MRSRFVRLVVVCSVLFSGVIGTSNHLRASAQGIVISEFRVRGPQGGNDEFIELFNASSSAVDIGGWKINGSNNTAGTGTRATINTGVTIQPGCFYLLTNSASGGYSGAVPGNQTYGTGITDDGGIALLTSANVVVDQVGMSSGSAYKEGTPLASLGSTTSSNLNRGYERKPGGVSGNATDTDNNSADFAVVTPSNPQNASSPCIGGATDLVPSVKNTAPADGATAVPINSTIQFTFSEPVTATANAFTIECPAGIPQPFTQSPAAGSATTVTLTPAPQWPSGTQCAVRVLKDQITDLDGTPDHMASDFAFTFTTLADAAPAVTATSPLASATNVAITTLITINFSESVSATTNAFTLQCPVGTPIGASQSVSPATSFTLTPASLLPYATSCTVTVLKSEITDTDTNDPPDNPAANFTFSFTTALPPGAGKVIINEIDADTPGSPQDTAEFVELYDGGAGNTPLDGLLVVFYDGTDTDATKQHKSYATFDLTGRTTNANGFFTIGNPAVPNVDLVFPVGDFGFLQNGPDAVALYAGNAAAFPNGTAVTTTNLLDAIVYGTDDSQDSALKVLLNAAQLQVNENATGDSADLSLQRCPNGGGGARNTASYYPATPTPGAANVCPAARPVSNVVISQVYGGGGNSGAPFHNDFVELFNRSTTTPVDLTGWSLQYASAAGNAWDTNLQPLGGTIGPGEYYLIALGATAGTVGAGLPPANITGQINMSATNGKVVLVSSFNPLVGGCPIFDAHVMDFVGYGSADCGEAMLPAAALSNTTALFRGSDGATDTDNNHDDFTTGAPNPNRRTAPIVELGPLVLGTDPRANATTAPRDATIAVTFTEPVDVDPAWFDITCATSGRHTDATFAGTGQSHYITPNVNFLAGETCTVTIFKDQVHDQDTNDSAPNTDTLPADYVWSFAVASGAPPAYPPSVHLTMGNPNGAVADASQPDNYLMEKGEYALSYNRALGRPNWVSWHLSDEWVGSLARVDTFRPDPAIPPDWYRVQSFDFAGTGFDRGHMTPNADRDNQNSIPINQATYLMSNMVAQAPGNNQGPWAAFEGYLRDTFLPANELYIIAGPWGQGGTGSNTDTNGQHFVTNTVADDHVTVPAKTWKVALVLPKNAGDDVSRVTCSTRTIAVIMPNDDGIRADDWTKYLTTVDAVETLTGYDFFSNVPAPYQTCIQQGKNGTGNGTLVPGTQTITFTPPSTKTFGDAPFTVSATGGKSGNPVTFVASGSCASGGVNGSLITITGAGACGITASQAGFQAANGDIVYLPADPAPGTVTIAKATPVFDTLTSTTIQAGSPSQTFTGNVTLAALIPTGTVTVAIGATSQTVGVGASGHFEAALATGTLLPSPTAYPVTYTYNGDANFISVGGGGTLLVQDTTPPTITGVTASPNVLGAPNHKMIDVALAYQASRDLLGEPVCSLGVASNEPVNGTGDGNTAADWVIVDAHHVQLRAERAGTGTGRIYTITVSCTDGSGNTASSVAAVRVPK